MIRKIKVMNMYSDLNTQLDIIVVAHNEKQVELAERIMTKSYNNWFDLEKNPNLQQVPFGDYLESQLKQGHIEYELYVKVGDNL